MGAARGRGMRRDRGLPPPRAGLEWGQNRGCWLPPVLPWLVRHPAARPIPWRGASRFRDRELLLDVDVNEAPVVTADDVAGYVVAEPVAVADPVVTEEEDADWQVFVDDVGLLDQDLAPLFGVELAPLLLVQPIELLVGKLHVVEPAFVGSGVEHGALVPEGGRPAEGEVHDLEVVGILSVEDGREVDEARRHLDADLAPPLLNCGEHCLVLVDTGDGEPLDLELLAVLLPNTVAVGIEPAGLVEELPGSLGVEAVLGL